MMYEHEHRLREIVRGTPWLVTALETVRDVGPAGAYVAAGSVRDTVWNWLTHRSTSKPAGDVDVVYYDPSEVSDCSRQYTVDLSRHDDTLQWEVTNQAWVHRWANHVEGRHEPHQSVEEGISTWPETATAVAIRLGCGDIDVVAPFGLDDLFALIVRHNSVRATAAEYANRIAAKHWAHRWPELRILAPDLSAG
jgi:uncharacterized protein